MNKTILIGIFIAAAGFLGCKEENKSSKSGGSQPVTGQNTPTTSPSGNQQYHQTPLQTNSLSGIYNTETPCPKNLFQQILDKGSCYEKFEFVPGSSEVKIWKSNTNAISLSYTLYQAGTNSGKCAQPVTQNAGDSTLEINSNKFSIKNGFSAGFGTLCYSVSADFLRLTDHVNETHVLVKQY